MATDFELLKAKITVEFDQVNKAIAAVRQLQRGVDAIRDTKIKLGVDEQVNKAAVSLLKVKQEEIRLETLKQKLARETQRIQREADQSSTAASRRQTSNLNRTAAAGRRVQQERRRAEAKAATESDRVFRKTQRDAAAARRETESLRKGLTALVLDLGRISARATGFTQLAGVISFVRAGIENAITTFRRLVAILEKASGLSRTASIALVGLGGLAASAALGFGVLAVAAARAAVNLGIRVLTFALNVVKKSILLLLTPLRALIAEVQRLSNVRSLIAFSSNMLEAAATMQAAKLQFEFTFGSRAQAEMDRLTKLSDKYGISLDAVLEQYSKFATGAKLAGIAIGDVQRTFIGILATARATGLDDDQVKGVVRALTQIASKGKVAAEELTGQLGDRMSAAFAEAAKSLGLTTAALNVELKKGEVTAQEFFAVFGSQLFQDFAAQADKAAGGLNAQLGRLKTFIFQIKAGIGDLIGIGPLRLLSDMTKVLREFGGRVNEIKKRLAAASEAFNKSFNFNAIRVLARVILDAFDRSLPSLVKFTGLIGKLAVIANGVLLAGFINFNRILNAINRILQGVLTKIEQLVGVEIRSLEDSFLFVAAVIENFDSILFRVSLFIGALKEAAKEIDRNILLVRIIVEAVEELARVIQVAAGAAPFAGLGTQVGETFERLKKEMKGIRKESEKAFDPLEGLDPASGIRKSIAELNKVGSSGSLIDPVEFSRRLLAANIQSSNEPLVVARQTASATQRTAAATEALLSLSRVQGGTPFTGQVAIRS